MSLHEERVLALLEELNEYGEHDRIEAKTGSDVGKGILETICAFSNEPGLDGGDLLLGVAKRQANDSQALPHYDVVGLADPERIGDTLASQCSSAFNRPLRPRFTPVSLLGKVVLHVRVPEVSPGDKPVYLVRKGLPGGAFRRLSATDQQCTDDDIQVLYDSRRRSTYDADAVLDGTLNDLDSEAVEEYRELRREIDPQSEELRCSVAELLQGLNCVREIEGIIRPTVAGLLLFGTPLALRRCFAMMRVDYIRVPGREWVPDPENRYTSVNIRAPLIRAVRRAEAAVIDDLPKAFHLPEGSLHRRDVSALPRKVLREAIVNAVMHRDYHTHGAVQIIRYSNRIEILNPGYSLKPPDRLGEPGSAARNPTIAAAFHDTNLAETKGTGIRAMRRLMKDAELVPPTFESSRADNRFTARFLLHHFLGEGDLDWLDALGEPSLSPEEKLALVFLREVGAVDNATYRDLTGADTLRASAGLRRLCDLRLLQKKGQSTATYYVPGERISSAGPTGSSPTESAEPGTTAPGSKSSMVPGKPGMSTGKPSMVSRNPSMAADKPSMVDGKSGMAGAGSVNAGTQSRGERQRLYELLPGTLRRQVDRIGPKADEATMRAALRALCGWQSLTADDLAAIVRRNADYLRTRYLKPMVTAKELHYTIPDMPKHPNQAYKAPEAGT